MNGKPIRAQVVYPPVVDGGPSITLRRYSEDQLTLGDIGLLHGALIDLDAERQVKAERVIALLEKLGFELFANELLNVDSDHNLHVISGLTEFREHLGGELTITLLRALGQGFEVHEMNLPKVVEAIYELQQRHSQRRRNVLFASA